MGTPRQVAVNGDKNEKEDGYAKKLCPQVQAESVVNLKPEFFICQGIRGVIIDLDNTLVAWGGDSLDPQMTEWVESMKAAGLKMCILSNALENRVKKVGDSLGLPFCLPCGQTPEVALPEGYGTDGNQARGDRRDR